MPDCSLRLINLSGPGKRPSPCPSTRAQAIGVKVRALNVENRMAPLMASAIG